MIIIIAIILFVLVVWGLFSIKIVGPGEMALYVFFGKPVYFVNSGFAFAPLLPKSGLLRYPKTLFNLDYPAQKIITRAGEYQGKEKNKGKKKGKKKKATAKEYGKQLIEIDSVVYMRFPRFFETTLAEGLRKDNASLAQGNVDPETMCIGLKKIVEQSIPKDEVELKKWTRDTVAATLRSVFGEVTWAEATENIKDLKEKLKELFSDSKNALTEAGFSPADMDIEIQEVRLTKELENLLREPDKARLKSEAAFFTARKQAAEQVGSVIEAFALARGKTVKTVQRELNKDAEQRKEFLSYIENINLRLEEADRNALIDIRVGDGDGNNRDDFFGSIVKAIAASKLVGEKKEKRKEDKEEEKEEEKEKENKEEQKEEGQSRKESIKDWLKGKANGSGSPTAESKEWIESWEKHKNKDKK